MSQTLPSADAERFTIDARDGRSYEFIVEQGRLATESSGKFSDASRALHTHPDGSVSSFSWNEFEDRVQVASISLQPGMRNSGVGFELYQRLAQRAIGQGKAFVSDSTVSSEALKIYPKLAALGYQVEYAPERDVVAFDHTPRDENDTTRPPGSQQLIGRDERPIARVIGKLDVPQHGAEPEYLRRLLEKPKAAPKLAEQAPPLPLSPALPPAPAAKDWLVALHGEPARKTEKELRDLIALDRVNAATLSRPAEGPGEWAPAGFQPELLGFIQRAKTPQWHIARSDPANPGSKKSFGPYTEQEVCKYAAQGLVKETDLAWAPGMPAWEPVASGRAGELARLGQDNAQAFAPALNLASKLDQRRQELGQEPNAPRPEASRGPRS